MKRIEFIKLLFRTEQWRLNRPFGDIELEQAVHTTGICFYTGVGAVKVRDNKRRVVLKGFFGTMMSAIPVVLLERRLRKQEQGNAN